jgi:hypothetical protein
MDDRRQPSLDRMTLRELLDAYADARLDRRADDMERLNREIDVRRTRGECP